MGTGDALEILKSAGAYSSARAECEYLSLWVWSAFSLLSIDLLIVRMVKNDTASQ